MKINNRQSLAARLSLWIISLGTVIFIVALISNYFLSRILLQNYVSDLAKTTTSSTVRNIKTIFKTAGFEPPTSSISRKRSNQTSHAPVRPRTVPKYCFFT
jgi:hypothetical protein